MAVVVLYLALSLVVSALFGVAVSRCLFGAGRELPPPYVAYRPDRHPAVLGAEHLVRVAYADVARLYDTPPTAPTPMPVRPGKEATP